MSESIEVSRMVPSSPEAIYKAWLSGPEHGQMTGSTATYNDDDTFTAWEGYISGKTTEKQPYSRIVQSWRTTEFLDSDPDSTLEILLEPQGDGTMVTLRQSNIPDGQGDAYRSGWEEHYFEPMIAYSNSARAKLNQAGHAVAEAAEAVGEAAEAAGEAIGGAAQKAAKSAQKAARSVNKTAKKAASSVKKFIAKAKKKLAARKAKPKKKAAPKKKSAPKKKKAAPKKKGGAKKKKK